MTHLGGKPHRVGYHGQKFMIVVTETYEEQHRDRVIAWSDKLVYRDDLKMLETRPGWRNARCEEVVDPSKPYGVYGADPWDAGQG